MSLIYQIPRNALWWLLIAQAAVILPHLNHLPIWLLLVWSLAVGWRVQMVRGAWGGPNRWLKALCAIGCVVALIISYGRLFALEPLVALLTVAFVLKLLELNRQRDVLLVLLLGFFVTATQLLFTSSLFAFIYAIFCCWLLITALMALHMASRSHSLWDSFGKSGGYMLQALPLAILLFFVMPRIGSLWSVPMAQGQGKTGFSKVMA
ncbi:MAG: DUF3488 domain-containing protein, partial [Cellvibrionaceae bacterium]|nr:DUF3488 domain-containing protein [Cellvibrionaceae bacterium]